jgi:hypothetical protein
MPTCRSLFASAAALCVMLAAAGCHSVPSRFKLEDTQFVREGASNTLAVKVDLFVPEGQDKATASHVILLGTPGALAVQGSGEQTWARVKQGIGALNIGWEESQMDDSDSRGEQSGRLCGVLNAGGEPLKMNIAVFDDGGEWAIAGELLKLGGDWRDADAREVCFDADSETDAILRLGKVLTDA